MSTATTAIAAAALLAAPYGAPIEFGPRGCPWGGITNRRTAARRRRDRRRGGKR